MIAAVTHRKRQNLSNLLILDVALPTKPFREQLRIALAGLSGK